MSKIPDAYHTWIARKVVSVADLTDAATSQSIAFDDTLPAGTVVLGSGFTLRTEFSGGSSTSCTADIGDAGDPNGWIAAADVFTGAGTGIKNPSGGAYLSASCDVQAAARAPAVLITSDVNVDTLTAGELEAWLVVKTPAPYSAIPLS